MRTIHKYPIDIQDHVWIEMPAGARIISLQPQKGQPCLWAIVDPNKAKERRHFKLYGTGHPLAGEEPKTTTEPHEAYVGTVLLYGDAFAFHLFEVR